MSQASSRRASGLTEGTGQSPACQTADDALLQRISFGHEEAMASLYDLYSGLVYQVAVRLLGDETRAEEIFHDVFLDIWRKPSTYRQKFCSLTFRLVTATRRRRNRIEYSEVSMQSRHSLERDRKQ